MTDNTVFKEIITLLFSTLPIISELVKDEGTKMNKGNNSVLKQINVNSIRRDAICQAVKQMSYVWLVIYTMVLLALQTPPLLKQFKSLNSGGKILVVIVIGIIVNSILADLPYQVAIRKMNTIIVGYNIDTDRKLYRLIDWCNGVLQCIMIILIAGVYCEKFLINIVNIVFIISLPLIVYAFKVAYHLIFIDREKLMLNWKQNVDIFELPPKASLRKVSGTDYRAFFRFTFKQGYRHDNETIFDYYEHDFSIENNGKIVIVLDSNRDVVAMFGAEDIVLIEIMIGANTITKVKEQGFSLKYDKKTNTWSSNGK